MIPASIRTEKISSDFSMRAVPGSMTISAAYYLHHSVDWSPDGKLIATATQDKTRIISYPEWKTLKTLRPAGVVKFSSDGKRLALLNDKKVEVVEVESGKTKCALTAK